MTHPAIEAALKYLHDRGSMIPLSIVVGLNIKEMKRAGEYQSIRQEMWAAVYDAVYDFLSGNAQVGTYSNKMSTAVSKAYIEAADTGYEDGGGTLPLDEDTAAWARAELDAQFGFIDSLFETLKQLRKEDDVDIIHEAFGHANAYSSSLDGYYNNIKLRAAGNKMLTFTQVKGTKESCDDCVRLRGQRHRASWFVAHDVVPPTGGGLACSGGGHCGDVLVDDDGEEFTI
jgi:hypothetical protein